MRGSRTLIRSLPLIALFGLVIYLMQPDSGRRWEPIVAVEFESAEYTTPLQAEDFASFFRSRNADCGDCTSWSDLSSPPGRGRVGFAFADDAAQLTVYFYGEGRAQVDPVVADFVAYLQASPRFATGFRVHEHLAEAPAGIEGERPRQ